MRITNLVALLLPAHCMLDTINFDDDFGLEAGEIQNVAVARNLSAEMQALAAKRSKRIPKSLLR